MALRPGPGTGGTGGAGGGAAGAASFMFPVAGGLGPPQGMIPMQQQGFPMVPVMQTNMPGMMGMNYGSQMPPGPMTMQGGMPLGPMPAAGMPYMGQASFLGMRPATPQYTPDMQKQFAEEQQKRFEHQQKFLEEERKRRQFEEQKQKLRLLSSVKPKTGEKSRDDALEAIKGNLDGFSRDAKMHPTPASHPKKPDHPTPSHPAVSVSHSAFPDDEEFSDFIQGPVEIPKLVPQPTSQPFQPFHPATEAGQLLSEKAVLQPLPPAQTPVLSTLHGTAGQVPYFPTSASSPSIHKTGSSLEEKVLANGSNESEQEQTKPKTSEGGHKASAASQAHPSLTSSDWDVVGGQETGPTAAEVHKASEQNRAVEECGVGVFPSQDPIQQMMPPWIYNDSLVPELYKKILESTLTPAGIDTAKLYPILMSSGLPRETLGQIWALANRTTPGQLTKEELYAVLAMVAVTQRGIPAVSPDVLNQFPAAPVPTLSGFPVALPAVSQPPLLPSAPPGSVPSVPSVPLGIGPPVMGMGIPAPAPAGGAAAQPSGAFLPSYPPGQVVKPEDDDFQEFQDASKSGSLDDSFTDFQGDVAGSSKAASSQHRSSVPSLLMPLPGNKPLSPADKYAVFKGMAAEKPPETAAAFGDGGDKYSAFRELEQPAESKYLGDNLAEFKPAGVDDGFTDFKTADSISPLEPPTKDKTFPAPFPPLPAQPKQQTQAKTPLNLADLDLFSSPGENKQPSFPPAFNTSKPGSFPPPPLPSTTAQPAPSKTSSLADDFGEFNLFGEFSNGASASGQDDFADFMAFNNSGGFSEQKPDDKYNALKLEAGPVPQAGSAASTVKGGQSSATTATPTKYDIFKQLSLEGSGAGFEEAKDSTLSSVKSDDDFADFHSNKFSSTGSSVDKSLVDKVAAFKQAKEDSASVKSLDLPSIGGSSVGKEDSEDALSVQFDMKLADVGGDLKHVMSDSSLDLPTVSGQHPPAAAFANFKDSGPISSGPSDDDIADFGDFARPSSEARGAAAADAAQEADLLAAGVSSELRRESTDDFGEFQSEKPKISKFDFLVATSQGKVKSSEEMIRSELATFDLSVQGSHKRSLSLGDREISRSSPLPALEQPFRDRSNTLSEKPALPVIRDKYKDLTGEVEESERYAYEWQRCLESALQVIKKANDTLNGISSSSVCTEVIQSAQGMEYLLGVVEVYRVTKRVELGIKATAVCSEKLQQLLKDIDKVWNNLISFMSLAALTPDENSLDFSSCMLRPGIKNAQDLACGVCLLNVDSRSKNEEKPVEELPRKAFNSETDNFKLAYGGHQYHASCANFWINCVEPKPPGLILPDLL
ncbi:synergin gamma isoform X3 [Myiozetetes cayanensis]|uniref:synergin gamma isoform X3 n=1 Tax=Myiozetetes cayanensis TaxID=478635 RepID=UPI00215E217C|nr:synergin gamma isoform X3 [Myiozetetes cayanensis]